MRTGKTVGLIALVAGLGWLDYATGPDFGFSLFYIMPISWASWRLGRSSAVLTALVAALCWLAADIAWRRYDYLPLSLWNGTTRVVIYVFVAVTIARLRKNQEDLAELVKREAERARTDVLSGLLNGRGLREHLARELARLQRSGTPAVIAYLDLDDFKKVNDVHGHAAGDAVIARVGHLLHGSLRAGDLAARIGGDEFVLVLWQMTAREAEVVASRVCEGIREIATDFPGTTLGASIGIAALDSTGDVETILRRADRAMYAAKNARKGSIVLAS